MSFQAGKGAILLNLEGRIAYANTYFCDLIGVDYTKIAGMSFFDFVFPEDMNRAKDLLELSKKLHSQSFRLKLRAADGKEVLLAVHGDVARTPSGVVCGVHATVAAAKPEDSIDAPVGRLDTR